MLTEAQARQLLGRRVRSLRLWQDLTQEALGERCGLNYKYLGAIERGECNPTLRQLVKLADGLHVDLHVLLTVEHEEPNAYKLLELIGGVLRDTEVSDLQRFYRVLLALVR